MVLIVVGWVEVVVDNISFYLTLNYHDYPQ